MSNELRPNRSDADRIRELEAQLAAERSARLEAEDAHKSALAAAQNAAILQSNVVEVPTGDTIDGEPVFFYKIDLPPSGGMSVCINETHYYHGQVYKFRLNTLRTVKEMVARSWGHEASIRGSNENAYRKPTNRVLRAQ